MPVSRSGLPKIQGPFFWEKKRLRQSSQLFRASKKSQDMGTIIFERTSVKYFPEPITERRPIKIITKMVGPNTELPNIFIVLGSNLSELKCGMPKASASS